MKLLFFLLFLSLYGKEPSENGIIYRPLSWSDFKAPVPENESAAALTSTQLVLTVTDDNDRYTFGVTSYFLPDSSYVRVKSESILRHEQTHFKISYLMAKECTLKLQYLQHGPEINAEKADSIYTQYCDASKALNIQFDVETGHGIKTEEERCWEERITLRLSKLVLQKTKSLGRN